MLNWTLGNKIQCNLNWTLYIFIQEHAFENVVWKMEAILSWPQCVKHSWRIWINKSHKFTNNNTKQNIRATKILHDWDASSWWRHQIETLSALLAFCVWNSQVTGEFPSQRPVTRSFDVFFDLRLNKPLGKQSWGWWFGVPSRSLWCHCHVPFHLQRLVLWLLVTME